MSTQSKPKTRKPRTPKAKKPQPPKPELSANEQAFRDQVSHVNSERYYRLAFLIRGRALTLWEKLEWTKIPSDTVAAVEKYLAAFDQPPKLDEAALATLLHGLPPETSK